MYKETSETPLKIFNEYGNLDPTPQLAVLEIIDKKRQSTVRPTTINFKQGG